MVKTFYSTSDWRNDPFFLWHWLFWIQSNFHATKKSKHVKWKCFTGSKRSLLVHFTQNSSNKQTQSIHRKARLEPAIRYAQKLAQNVFPPWRCRQERRPWHTAEITWLICPRRVEIYSKWRPRQRVRGSGYEVLRLVKNKQNGGEGKLKRS